MDDNEFEISQHRPCMEFKNNFVCVHICHSVHMVPRQEDRKAANDFPQSFFNNFEQKKRRVVQLFVHSAIRVGSEASKTYS